MSLRRVSFGPSGLALAAALVGVPVPSQAQEPVTAFVNVAVIPMDRERVLPGQTVVVRGGRIAALGPAGKVRVPAGAVRVDGRGKFLIPGLADMHAHVPAMGLLMRGLQQAQMTPEGVADAERRLLLYAAYGVTTVRIMYGWRDNGLLALRARAARGELLSPRIYAAAGPPGDLGWSRHVDSIAPFVAAAKAAGYDFLKLHGESGPVFDSAVAAARRVGLPIVGHPPYDSIPGASYRKALEAGYTSIEHLYGFQDDTTLDEASLRARAAATKRAGVWHCPTQLLLEVTAGLTPPITQRLLSWSERRFVADSMLARLHEAAAAPGPGSAGSGAAELARAAALRRITRALHAAGVGLLLGTDAGVPGLLPGAAVHHELETLVGVGLTPYEALLTSTRNVAAYLGTLDSTGTVAVGKRADLVLVAGNPLADIRHTAEITGVMLNGRWLGRDELDHRLKAIEGTLPYW